MIVLSPKTSSNLHRNGKDRPSAQFVMELTSLGAVRIAMPISLIVGKCRNATSATKTTNGADAKMGHTNNWLNTIEDDSIDETIEADIIDDFIAVAIIIVAEDEATLNTTDVRMDIAEILGAITIDVGR